MMKSLVNHWHEASALLGAAVAVCAILFVEDPVQKCLFAAIVAMLLHFYEEFGFPGGLPAHGREGAAGKRRARLHEVALQQPELDVRQLDGASAALYRAAAAGGTVPGHELAR